MTNKSPVDDGKLRLKVTNLAHQLKRQHGGRRFPPEFSTSTQRQHRTAKEEMRVSVLSGCENHRERVARAKAMDGDGRGGKKKKLFEVKAHLLLAPPFLSRSILSGETVAVRLKHARGTMAAFVNVTVLRRVCREPCG